MKHAFLLLTAVLGAALLGTASAAAHPILPEPQSFVAGDGRFVPQGGPTFAIVGSKAPDLADYAAEAGFVRTTKQPQLTIRIGTRESRGIAAEGYRLQVTKRGIAIDAATETGAFYGLQSLLQLREADGSVPCATIADAPRFGYRGVMLDVSRHFRSKEFILKQIDAFAKFKLNRLHLHLTDAAGWRIEIAKYPRLTELAAWRPAASWLTWWSGDRRYCEASDPRAAGGFYTRDELREIVEYARRRHVEVIPEIEMPAHSEEVFAAYPELTCTGLPYGSADFCAGSEAVYTFLEDVLTEVLEIFPSEYIHIGGDEAGKQHWHTCPKCQAVMQREGLQSVDELQSWFIGRMVRFLAERGRKAIGWDEILDGGLPEGAAVMSWRGEEGGLRALQAGHEAIMTPGKYCYINHPQDAPFTLPQALSGYLPLEKVYAYTADYPQLTEAERGLLLGVQANLWAEYVETDEHTEQMLYPRVLAIAETTWSQPQNLHYADFRTRAIRALEPLRAAGYAVFDLEHEYGERPESLQPLHHKAVGCPVSYAQPWHASYEAAGAATLTDGLAGGWSYGDGRWQGFLDSDFDVTVDLGTLQPVHYVGVTFMQATGPEVYMPTEAAFYGSADGETFVLLGRQCNDLPDTVQNLLFRTFAFAGEAEARYIRCVARHPQKPGGWLFADEIVVY